jgi:flagellar biosynthesis protein
VPPQPAPQQAGLAVALAYERERDDAPRVVAKGRDQVAAAILEVARAHGVPVRKDAPLASLLAAVELDSVIPIEAYVAVAQILSVLYRDRAHPPPKSPR